MPLGPKESGGSQSNPDPVWLHSAGEGRWILLLSTTFLVWTVGYSYVFGYGPQANTNIVFGLPGWVTWGIALPWTVATVVSVIFALLWMRDDRLDEDVWPGTEEEGHAGL